jgi:hypothetical protein
MPSLYRKKVCTSNIFTSQRGLDRKTARGLTSAAEFGIGTHYGDAEAKEFGFPILGDG